MTRFVVDAPVALRLAVEGLTVPKQHALLAPTLMRSEVLALVYASVRAGERDETTAKTLLDGVRALRIRLLGDRVLQARAWAIARSLDWADTFKAEYVALTELQADAFVTLDAGLRTAAAKHAEVATFHELFD